MTRNDKLMVAGVFVAVFALVATGCAAWAWQTIEEGVRRATSR